MNHVVSLVQGTKGDSFTNNLKGFSDEKSFKHDFKNQYEEQGVTCGKYVNDKSYWLQYKWQLECKSRKFKITFRSGGSIKEPKVSFYHFYLAAMFMTFKTIISG